jgi:putative transposase
MPNHVHILVRTGREPLSRVMSRILTGYAVSFNRRYKRTGHLFQNRFKSILVEEEPYLLQLVRYIHLNPLRGSVVKTIEELATYRWSGHSALLGLSDSPWQDSDYVLAYFGRTTKTARNAYHAYVKQGIDNGQRADLSGGGLIRSSGGKDALLRRGREAWASDERILGSSEFVQAVHTEHRDVKPGRRALDDIIRDVSEEAGLSVAELVSGNRRRDIVIARSFVCSSAVREHGFTITEVARALNVSKQSILRGVEKGKQRN